MAGQKPTIILGISAFYHDSAASLLVDGKIVAAAQEERFSRKKHDFRFPKHAIDYCLNEAGCTPSDIDYVAFYEKPILKFDRLLETYLSVAPAGFKTFVQAIPLWIRQKLHLSRQLDEGLKHQYKGRFVYPEHHESHAASAFFASPFEEAAIMTLDGVGEWATTTCGIGRGNKIELTHEIQFPHSLGLLYSAFTYYTGFRVNSGEYKLMGLAPYGRPIYTEKILDNLIDLKEDGSFRMDMSFFNYCQGETMTSAKFHDLFDGPPRTAETKISQKDMDLAASIQVVTEDAMLRMSRNLQKETGAKHLVLAGGVALNCVGNGKILRDETFEKIWIQPAAGDAGGSLGAALFTWHQLLDNPREVNNVTDLQRASLLGPKFENDHIKAFLDETGAKYTYYEDEEKLNDVLSDYIIDSKVIGHFQGRAEFGPRALGCRSIIGDARSREMQSVMNLKIKFRESFRPFAPCVLREHVQDWFDMRDSEDSAYMLLVADVKNTRRNELNGEDKERIGLDKLKVIRSTVPAITHVDFSARVQTVDEERHGRYYRLMKKFYDKTGCPVIINTSFNIRGEPIVGTPEHAYRCFMATNMDVLVLENCVLVKDEQPEVPKHEIDEYVAQFDLD